MLKFLDNREPIRSRRGKDYMRCESESHLPNNRQFNSPIHQDALIQNDKPSYYITKKLPPIKIYNPLVESTEIVQRPEYIVKQKNIYVPRYMEEYKQKGFKKKQGIFESFQHLLNQNKSLIQGVHSDKKPIPLPLIKYKEPASLPILPQLSNRSRDSINKSRIDKSFNTHKSIDQRKSVNSKQGTPYKLLTESKGIQVNIEEEIKHKRTEFMADYSYKFNEIYAEQQAEKEEKEKQMRQLSIFDKKIKEFKEQQKAKLMKQQQQ